VTDDERYEQETKEHVATVEAWMGRAIQTLATRSIMHDQSKFQEPERSGFQAMTADARLKELTYGSDEYRAVLREHKPTIQHHYDHNDHHPEHSTAGVYGMSLLALIEMLCDWKASTSRMRDGDLLRSIDINSDRFGYDDNMKAILIITARELGMVV
jgi:hypothetical protein